MTRTEPQSGAPRRALGRGLDALLPRVAPEPPAEAAGPSDRVARLPLDLIDPNPNQPRRVFERERLEELAASIRAEGVIQPVVVRRRGDRYILVIGERRLRAAQMAGFKEIPAIVREIPEERLLEVTLIENIQREDLNPMEAAAAFEQMSEELGLSQEEIAERTGKDRATISNLTRLLRLPHAVQQLIWNKKLSMGHARAILSLKDQTSQLNVAEKAARLELSVREVERWVKHLLREGRPKTVTMEAIDPNVLAAIQELEELLGTRVRLVPRGKQKGRIEIEYYSTEELERIYSIVVKGCEQEKRPD
jgi:ParB family chromosome partitioning protein